MTNPDLAALSAAATQGEWTVCVYDAGDHPHYDINGGCPSIQSESEDCAVVHWDGFKQKYWTSANGNQRQIEANAAFIVGLVNAYRTGNLIQIDREGMRERVMTKLANADLVPPDDPDEYWGFLADAAIAAILGGE